MRLLKSYETGVPGNILHNKYKTIYEIANELRALEQYIIPTALLSQ